MLHMRSACVRLMTQMLLPGWALGHCSCKTKRHGRRLLALARACRCGCSGGAIIVVRNAEMGRQRSFALARASSSIPCAAATSREVEHVALDRARDRVVRARCSLRCWVAPEMPLHPIDPDSSLVQVACARLVDGDPLVLGSTLRWQLRPCLSACSSDSSDGCEDVALRWDCSCSLALPRARSCRGGRRREVELAPRYHARHGIVCARRRFRSRAVADVMVFRFEQDLRLLGMGRPSAR
jgi:hypothetical protein